MPRPDAAFTALTLIASYGDKGLPAGLERFHARAVAGLGLLVGRTPKGRLCATAAGRQALAAGAASIAEAVVRARPMPAPGTAWLAADLAAWQARLGLDDDEAARRLRMRPGAYRDLLPTGRRSSPRLPEWIGPLCSVIELAEACARRKTRATAAVAQLVTLFGPLPDGVDQHEAPGGKDAEPLAAHAPATRA